MNHLNWTTIAQDMTEILRHVQLEMKAAYADFNSGFKNPNKLGFWQVSSIRKDIDVYFNFLEDLFPIIKL